MDDTIKLLFFFWTPLCFRVNMSNTGTYTFQNCSLKNINSSCFQWDSNSLKITNKNYLYNFRFIKMKTWPYIDNLVKIVHYLHHMKATNIIFFPRSSYFYNNILSECKYFIPVKDMKSIFIRFISSILIWRRGWVKYSTAVKKHSLF